MIQDTTLYDHATSIGMFFGKALHHPERNELRVAIYFPRVISCKKCSVNARAFIATSKVERIKY